MLDIALAHSVGLVGRGRARGERMNERRRSGGTATETLIVMTLVGVLVAGTACSSGGSSGDDDDAGDSGAGEEPAGPVPGAAVARPIVTGPVAGGTHDQPFNAMPEQLAARYGYVEEYVLEGDATAYRPHR